MARNGNKKLTLSELSKVLAHPLRVEVLKYIDGRDDGVASPNEIANALGQPLGNVSYHVRQLSAMGVLKLKKKTPRRGAIEHHYELAAVAQQALRLEEAAGS